MCRQTPLLDEHCCVRSALRPGIISPSQELSRRLRNYLAVSGIISPSQEVSRHLRNCLAVSGIISPSQELSRRHRNYLAVSGIISPSQELSRRHRNYLAVSGIVSPSQELSRRLRNYLAVSVVNSPFRKAMVAMLTLCVDPATAPLWIRLSVVSGKWLPPCFHRPSPATIRAQCQELSRVHE